MKQYTVYQIDAFTRSMFKGNPAGMVDVMVAIRDQKPCRVKIGGRAVVIFKTAIERPN